MASCRAVPTATPHPLWASCATPTRWPSARPRRTAGTCGPTLRSTPTTADLPGWERRETYVRTLSDRSAITHTLSVVDLGGPWSDVTVEGLAAVADFDACPSATELVDRVACSISPTDGEGFEVCTEGGDYDEL